MYRSVNRRLSAVYSVNNRHKVKKWLKVKIVPPSTVSCEFADVYTSVLYCLRRRLVAEGILCLAVRAVRPHAIIF